MGRPRFAPGEATPTIRDITFEGGDYSQVSATPGASHAIVNLGSVDPVLGQFVSRRSWTADTDQFSSFTDVWPSSSNEIWFRYRVRWNEMPLGSTGCKLLRFNSLNSNKTGLLWWTLSQIPAGEAMALTWASEGAGEMFPALVGVFSVAPQSWWANSGHASAIIRGTGTAFRITGHVQNAVNLGSPRTSAQRVRFWVDGVPVVHPDNTDAMADQGYPTGWAAVNGWRWLAPDGAGQPSWLTSAANSTATAFASAEMFDQLNATKSGNGSVDNGGLAVSTLPLLP